MLAAVTDWARSRSVRGLALVGSHARGQAGPGSDIDLMFLVYDPEHFRAETSWLGEIDWEHVGTRPVAQRDIQYGVVLSRHVQLDGGLKAEFSFGPPSWADVAPVDAGTRRVVTAGFRILHDPDGILSALCHHIFPSSAPA